VTHGKDRFYAFGKPYHAFVGRDASRAFITGCISDPSHLTRDLRGLSNEQMKVVPFLLDLL
jgi:hypothetical protein